MSVAFEEEIVNIASMVEPEGCEVSPEAIAIAAESLGEIAERYGPESDNPLSFHNADHSVGVTRRSVRLTNILYDYILPKYREGIYDLAVIDGATHDYEQSKGPGESERASSDYAVGKVSEKGGPLNTDWFKKRLSLGIFATAVRMEDDGELVQSNLQSGARDPIKFIMAFGDINGIAMEGSSRMWKDATSLYYEITEEPTIDGLYNFLIGQAVFLKQRLNDGRVKSDIAYYFPKDIEDVYADMHAAFHSNIISAHSMALLLGQMPELKIPVEAAVRSIGALDRSLLGDLIGRALRGKLSD